jgi:simple sugar transport system ATP-binding protein
MNKPIYEIRGVSKRYGNVQALSHLDFHIGAGEVVGLLGDNGAGKSTLIKLMSGIVRPDDGEVLVDGAPAIVKSRRDSEHIGIETIYQDTALVDTMSIVRNIFMGREITNRWGFLNHRLMREIASDVLSSGIHISGIDTLTKRLAICRAVRSRRSPSPAPSISSDESCCWTSPPAPFQCARPWPF